MEEPHEGLTQAQPGRLESRMDRVEAILETLAMRVDQLAQAQARTEQRVEELAQAQARTEQRLEALAARVDQLALAQARTEQSLQQLATQVGALAENVGYGLEDIARVVLPGYLKHRYGITVDRLERRIFQVDGQTLDVDLYAEGRQQRRRVVVLGEVKSRIYAREVGQFQKLLQLIQPQLPAQPLPLMFGYFIDLSAMEAAKEEILLIASYQPAVELPPPSLPQRWRKRRRRT